MALRKNNLKTNYYSSKRLRKNRVAERLRYQKIKNNPVKYEQQKIKEKMWSCNARDINNNSTTLQNSENEVLPPSSSLPPPPKTKYNDKRMQIARNKSICARKARNLSISTQAATISKLKTKIE
ncbi:unnamed protein product [Diatraea saccharalis]|uniref:Uncharacterized protein n=1 Tax=Diatraea saccharalis TaxID=40085 RepID=A0A9N9QTF5_9NEOP|nr:unnamed protein product [Diatraea saccharalis]